MIAKGLFLLAAVGCAVLVLGVSELLSLPGCPGEGPGRRRCEAPPGTGRGLALGFGGIFSGALLLVVALVRTGPAGDWRVTLGMPLGTAVALVVAMAGGGETGPGELILAGAAVTVSTAVPWAFQRALPPPVRP
ncbi:hypothetical protein ABT354_10060 [Streptomyces sp. NPDC000594]|uniref:hypothetical protein n=1 Tax=Streptomyces sp. NPDC000594 TaxID=3154261 RepID=UPI0033323FE0